jgi:hypothetical protein
MSDMKRREFITLLGGAAAWPLAARAQQPDRMRRIGVLMNLAADDPESTARVTAFAQGLQELGWTIGRNVQIDTRWAAADADLFRRYVAELVAAAPDVILASTSYAVAPLRQATRTVPIVGHWRKGPEGRLMGQTKRIPINRPARRHFTPEVLAMYRELLQLPEEMRRPGVVGQVHGHSIRGRPCQAVGNLRRRLCARAAGGTRNRRRRA